MPVIFASALIGFLLASLLFTVRLRLRNKTDSSVKDPQNEERLEKLNAMVSTGFSSIYSTKEFSILLFGPSLPNKKDQHDTLQTAIWEKRQELRRALENTDFFVIYGEELMNSGRSEVERKFNPLLKEKLIAEQVNLILILAASVGAGAELALFSQHPSICRKMVVALYEKHEGGFLATGPVREASGYGAYVINFTDSDLESCNLKTVMYNKAMEIFEGFLSHKISMKLIGYK